MISSLVLAAIPVVTVCGYTQSRDLIVQSHDSESQRTAYYYAEENSLLFFSNRYSQLFPLAQTIFTTSHKAAEGSMK